MKKKIIELKGLEKHYPVFGGVLKRQVNSVKALDGIDLDIYRGECLGVVGESGCGKTTTGKAIINLHAPTGGEAIYYPEDGDPMDLAKMSNRQMKNAGIRSRLQMVFQDPTTSLNPRMLIKHIIAEPIKEQEKLSARELEKKIVSILEMVGLSRMHLMRYPHEFSGGQRQRIAVARAIAASPEFIVLDEPTSALDVSVQAQILNLLDKLRKELNLTYLFVTHHLLVVKYISTRIAVMYLGKCIETCPTDELFSNPLHPYTHALLSGIPNPEVAAEPNRIVLEGDVPSPLNPPSGCRFHTRCPFCIDVCSREEPVLLDVGNDHKVACHRQDVVKELVKEKFGIEGYF
ncbi:oligopeptide/dipeptide ABC transporter ATP-binding protein [Halodesulfovibrio sp.]|uniref:ABC transporter ATP-binding protein n=1 Tax=Halodesulfovibrio sp. TaxID=1912772 RepID=UPI0025C59829|nr:oligopeptide/dipeptide ABC transporter ATP-binding protein [Halodesulfovibrio sp.]